MKKLILQENKKHTFSDYFNLTQPIEEIVAELGYEFSPVANIGAEILTLEKAVRSGIVTGNLMTKMLCGGRMEAVNWQDIETGPHSYGANFCGFGFPAQVWRGEIDAVLKQPDVQPDNDLELLECAMKNMREHFLFIGLTENMAQAVAVLGQHLDWDDYAVMPEVNVNKNKQISIIDDATRVLIEEYNALDLQLYQFVQQLPNSCFLNPVCIGNEMQAQS